VPEVWAGRQAELADFTALLAPRRLAGIYERGRLVTGEPGIGKSVLVGRVARTAAADGHWVAPNIRVAAGEDPLARLAEGVRGLVSTLDLAARVEQAVAGLLGRVEELTLPVVGGGVRLRPAARTGAPHREIFRLLTELGRLAWRERRLLVIRVDEVQHLRGPALSQLLTILGDVLNEEVVERDAAGLERAWKLPVAVYLSGLPEFAVRASEARTTFARRFKPLELEPLEEVDLRQALAPFATDGWPVLTDDGPAAVHLEPTALDLLVERSLGSPYLFQLVGDASWNAGTGRVVTRAEVERGHLATRREIRAYASLRLADLTERQIAYLRAAASLPAEERRAGAVAAAMGETSETLAPTARALDERHGVIRRSSGRVSFRSAALEALLRDELA